MYMIKKQYIFDYTQKDTNWLQVNITQFKYFISLYTRIKFNLKYISNTNINFALQRKILLITIIFIVIELISIIYNLINKNIMKILSQKISK